MVRSFKESISQSIDSTIVHKDVGCKCKQLVRKCMEQYSLLQEDDTSRRWDTRPQRHQHALSMHAGLMLVLVLCSCSCCAHNSMNNTKNVYAFQLMMS